MNVSVYIGAEHFSYDFFKEMLYKMLTPYTTSWFVNRTISRASLELSGSACKSCDETSII